MTEPAPHTSTSRTEAEASALLLEREVALIVQEELGLKEQFATAFAQAIVKGLRERLGGDDIYIPAPDKSERNAQIRAMFNGRNLKEVCARFGVGHDTVYRAVKSRGG